MFAVVAIDVAGKPDDTYIYRIPPESEAYIGIGSRVTVDFGYRKVLAFVLELRESTDYSGFIRDIGEILDFAPQLTEEQIAIGKKIAYDTDCPIAKALEAMYPYFLRGSFRKYLTLKNPDKTDPDIFLLFGGKKRLAMTSSLIKTYPKIRKEIEAGNLTLDYDLVTYGKRRAVKVYSLNPDNVSEREKLTGTRKKIAVYLSEKIEATADDLKEATDCSGYLIGALLKEKILLVREKALPAFSETKAKDKSRLKEPSFNFDQRQLRERFYAPGTKPFLFYSEDDRFTLDFYLDICIGMIRTNKKVLIMTPTHVKQYEIFRYLDKNLPGFSVLGFTGDIPKSEYYQNYLRVLGGDADVVVTTKIGAFLPLSSLGAIIVVDEADFNYINEMTPKFNTAEVMKFRASQHRAKLVLSSYPLTVENYHRYFRVEYNLLKYIVPAVHRAYLADMYEEIIADHPIISRKLEKRLEKVIGERKQAMLILNTRGYGTSLVCRSCGRVATCPTCNIPLTYYKEKNEIRCRYCNMKLDNPQCSCGNGTYSPRGIGLEKVRETLRERWPLARIMLLDSETVRSFDDRRSAVLRIEDGDVDFVIGTNGTLPYCKYGNFDVIGFIAIDNQLQTSDYRASYETYSLITNALKAADVVIQGFNLDHYAIRCAAVADFGTFYNEEIGIRETFRYPPFYEINRIIITGPEMFDVARRLRNRFRMILGNNGVCLGPTYNRARRGAQLVLKHRDYPKVLQIIEDSKKADTKPGRYYNYERWPRSFG